MLSTEPPKSKDGRFLKGYHYGMVTEFKHGLIPWSKGKNLSENHKKKMAASLRGRKAWNKGTKGLEIGWNKGLTKETDERVKRISLSLRNRKFSLEHRRHIAEACKGKKAWNKGEKRPWLSELNRDPTFIQKKLRGLIKYPSGPEQELMKIIKEENLPLVYTGDGSKIIGGLNPDFVDVNGLDKIIEVFGRVYHDPEKSYFEVPNIQREATRKAIYKKLGFGCLIVWEEELKNPELVVAKITSFLEVLK